MKRSPLASIYTTVDDTKTMSQVTCSRWHGWSRDGVAASLEHRLVQSNMAKLSARLRPDSTGRYFTTSIRGRVFILQARLSHCTYCTVVSYTSRERATGNE